MQTSALAVAASSAALAMLPAQSAPRDLPQLGFTDAPLAAPLSHYAQLRFDETGDFAPVDAVVLDDFTFLSPMHQSMVVSMFGEGAAGAGAQRCWHVLPSPQVAAFFNAAMQGGSGFQANPNDRWSATSTNGGGLQRGDPTTIRYSFIPDGTFIGNLFGEGNGTSSLFSNMNGAFGNPTVWQGVVQSAFDRWGELTGVTYVFEPNDDGAPFGNSGGIIGVRGDVRIAMKFIDGGSGILAANFFPNNGDMVLDSADTGFFASPAQNYRRLFNVIAHEHGHGLGIEHVCPINTTKLMEPTYTSVFNGPQLDDILAGQRLYGDANEPNDNTASATDLGTLTDGLTNVTTQSIDGTSDTDYFRFGVASPKFVTISLVPTGSNYLEGPQLGSGNCSSGTSYNPTNNRNLALYLFNSAGTALIQFAFAAPAGQPEVLTSVPLDGDYVVRVIGTGADTIQPYRLEFDVVDNGPVAAATSVGAGCNGLSWNPINRPRIGTTMVHTLTGIANPPLSIGLVLTGTVSIPGGLDLSLIGAPGCRVYQQTTNILPYIGLPSSTFVHTLPIPNNPALAGTSIWTQGALLVPPGTNAFGGITANATELFLGTQ